MRGHISPDDAEAILSGGVPTDPSFAALAELVQSIDLEAEVPAALAGAHIAAAANATGGVAAPRQAVTRLRRRRLAFGSALSGVTAKIILGTAVAMAATGGAAAVGILPDPIQNTIADGAAHLGIEIPHPGHATTTTAAPGEVPSTTTPATTSTIAPVAPAVLAGVRTWTSTACAGDAIAIHYEFSDDGAPTVVDTVGEVATIDESTGRIEVRFADGVTVRIDLRLDGPSPEVTVDERRDCDSGDDGDDSDDSDDSDDTDDTDDTDGSDDSDDTDDTDDSDDSDDSDDPATGDDEADNETDDEADDETDDANDTGGD